MANIWGPFKDLFLRPSVPAKKLVEDFSTEIQKLIIHVLRRFSIFKDHDDFEDLAQEAFLRILLGICKLKEHRLVFKGSPYNFIYTVVKNLVIDYLRKNKIEMSIIELSLDDVKLSDLTGEEIDYEEIIEDRSIIGERRPTPEDHFYTKQCFELLDQFDPLAYNLTCSFINGDCGSYRALAREFGFRYGHQPQALIQPNITLLKNNLPLDGRSFGFLATAFKGHLSNLALKFDPWYQPEPDKTQ